MRVLETMRQQEVADLDAYAFEDHPDHYSHSYRHNEKWVRVENWEDYYSVSNHGRIRGEKSHNDHTFPGRILSPSSRNGYPQITLYDGFRSVVRYVHRMVAVAFLGPPPSDSHQVNHKDGNRKNNRASNFEWVTSAENVHHYHRVLRAAVTGVPWVGRKSKKTMNPGSCPRVLTESIVIELRKRWASGVKVKELAACFNLKPRTVYSVVKRENWQHVA